MADGKYLPGIETRKIVWTKQGERYEIIVDPDGIGGDSILSAGIRINYYDTARSDKPNCIMTIGGSAVPHLVLAIVQLIQDEKVCDYELALEEIMDAIREGE